MSEISHQATQRTKSAATQGNAEKSEKGARKPARTGSSIKLQIDFPSGVRLGPGKIALLEAIDSAGSLSRGAAQIGMSYRRAWLFMQQINQSFDQPAVSTPESGQGGGAAKLTDFGRELIRQFRTIEKKAISTGGDVLNWLDQHHTGKGEPRS